MSATNPESGTINYAYDNNGNLTSKTDARSITTTYAYDNLNRVKTRTCNDGLTPAVSYYYDNLTNAKGKLTKVSSSVSTTEYTAFDILGRVTQSKQTTDGVTYGNGSTDSLMTYTYNLGGAMTEQQYPSGRVVKNVLDPTGDLSVVQSKKNSNSGFFTYASAFSYTPAGALNSMKLGNGKWESTVFNNRLQPLQIALGTVQNGTDKLRLNFDYGSTANNGNIISQKITVPGSPGITPLQTYTYDSLNRLQSADEKPDGWVQSQCTSTPSMCWKQTFTYDRYGNRRFDEANTTMPTSFANQAVTDPTVSTSNNRLTSSGYSYDNAGNTLTDAGGKTFTYDGENKQIQVNSGATVLGQYVYDGDGRRVKKVVPATGETAIFVYDAVGKQIAEYSTIIEGTSTAKVNYLTSDHLGSPRINTDANGAIISRHDYHPFGEEIGGVGGRTTGLNYGSDGVRKQFTSYERDNETNLDFAQARYFASGFGRFSSADPFGGKIMAPQTLNRYSYVVNNPLKYIDPSGLECADANRGDGDTCIWVSNGNGLYDSLWSSQFKKGNDLFDNGYTTIDPTTVQPFVLNDINNNAANPNNTNLYAHLLGQEVFLGSDGLFHGFSTDSRVLDGEDPYDMQNPGPHFDGTQLTVPFLTFQYSRNYNSGAPGQEYSGVFLGVGVPRFGISNIGGPGTTNSGLVGAASACAILCGGVASTFLDENGESHPIDTFTPGFGAGTPQANAGLGIVLPMSRGNLRGTKDPYTEGQLRRFHPGYYRGTVPY